MSQAYWNQGIGPSTPNVRELPLNYFMNVAQLPLGNRRAMLRGMRNVQKDEVQPNEVQPDQQPPQSGDPCLDPMCEYCQCGNKGQCVKAIGVL